MMQQGNIFFTSPGYQVRHCWWVEPFIGVEIHMEMDMEWKWMEMGHNLSKCFGLIWIWGKAINLKR